MYLSKPQASLYVKTRVNELRIEAGHRHRLTKIVEGDVNCRGFVFMYKVVIIVRGWTARRISGGANLADKSNVR
jgi:hypothetical protein